MKKLSFISIRVLITISIEVLLLPVRFMYNLIEVLIAKYSLNKTELMGYSDTLKQIDELNSKGEKMCMKVVFRTPKN